MFLELSWLIPSVLFIVLPLIPLLETKKGYAGALLAIIAGCISTAISIGGLIEIINREPYEIKVTWIAYKNIELNFGIYADKLSMFMAFIVSFIGTLIMIYSLEYMSHDKEKNPLAWPRYFFEIAMFVAFMLMLVLSYSLLQLLIAWEGVGLCSYLLIGYWWWKPDAAKAAKKAFITTRLGDIGLYAAVVYTYLATNPHTLDIPTLNSMAETGAIPGTALAIIALCAFWAAIGKSAQIPLFTWLPWAMEGPTTVSALIHAATMVKAGIFLVARIYPVYENAASIWGIRPLTVVAYIGALTAAFAGLVAVINNDIKGVLAYSTVSHLGLLLLALGVGAYGAALFHLLNHAFFKAELFLVSGCVLHATHDLRDLHKLGGIRDKMKFTWLLALLGSLAIAGVPPFGGFWSKDEILAGVSATGDVYLFILGFIAAVAGTLYIFRWFFLIFHGEPKSEEAKHAHEMPYVMTIPVAILAGGALLWGIPVAIWKPFGLVFVEKVALSSHSTAHVMAEAAHGLLSHTMIMLLTLVFFGINIGLMSYIYYLGRVDFSKYPVLMRIQGWFQQGTFIDKAYDAFVYYLFPRGFSWLAVKIDSGIDWIFESFHTLGAKLSAVMAEVVDIRIIDAIVEGFRPFFRALGRALGKIQTGHIGDYMVLFGIGLIFLSSIFVLYWLGWLSLTFLVPA